jgi:hypothetical protein
MKGWKFIFLPEVVAPAEIPVEMSAFKSQQHRWAKGSIQTAMKLLPRILTSELPYAVKKEAFFHLTANVAYLLMIPLAILMPITVVVRVSHGWIEVLLLDLPFFATATMSVCVFYVASQREIHASTWQRIKYLPYLMALGIGLSVNQARAVVEALLGHQTAFTRTPKSGVQGGTGVAPKRRYRMAVSLQPVLELALAAYFTLAVVWTIDRGVWYSLPFLVLFQAGFAYVGLMSAIEGLRDFWSRFVPAPQQVADAE